MTHPASITNRIAGDLAITAAEGGIGYWAQIDTYQPSRWDNGQQVDDDFVFYLIAQEREDGQGYDWAAPIKITPALIKRGWRKAFAVNALRSWLDLDDPDCTDAVGADVVIQLGALGEVTYS